MHKVIIKWVIGFDKDKMIKEAVKYFHISNQTFKKIFVREANKNRKYRLAARRLNKTLQIFSHLPRCNSISFLEHFLKVAVSIVTNGLSYLYNG